jgi:hypothetical protein
MRKGGLVLFDFFFQLLPGYLPFANGCQDFLIPVSTGRVAAYTQDQEETAPAGKKRPGDNFCPQFKKSIAHVAEAMKRFRMKNHPEPVG